MLPDGDRATPDLLNQELSKDGVVMLKCVDQKTNRIIGCAHTHAKHDTVHVKMLCVQPNLQGGGIGRKILNHIDELAKTKGCKWTRVAVISQRTELVEFYQRRGYTLTGERSEWEMEGVGNPKNEIDCVVLRKQLF